jgi:hypothetical protein
MAFERHFGRIGAQLYCSPEGAKQKVNENNDLRRPCGAYQMFYHCPRVSPWTLRQRRFGTKTYVSRQKQTNGKSAYHGQLGLRSTNAFCSVTHGYYDSGKPMKRNFRDFWGFSEVSLLSICVIFPRGFSLLSRQGCIRWTAILRFSFSWRKND